jgi:hypothetical protein
MDNPHVEKLLEEDYEFKFGDYISDGFSILKDNLGGFVIFTILFIGITTFVSLIPFIGSMINTLVISPALVAGMYIVAHKVWKDENREFGDFFSGFNHVTQLALVALVSGIILLLSLIPFGMLNMSLGTWYWDLMQNMDSLFEDPEILMEGYPGFSSWTFVLLIPAIYLGLAYTWAPLFVVFHKLNFWDALEASRIMITKKWFIYLLFIIVLVLIVAVGFLGFCIGLLFTIPAYYCIMFAAFADVTRLDEIDNSENGDILDHLVD